ncbi:LysR substrate-binding domain-containing protein [Pelagibius sp. Alg239-R121]|uniref:LysR substrate-binding domain-containing protein n=1 Tax=Pelagibius sp. Alg239-R121 TaxID=2993448 RepID=UPI0024A68793|nr:LysR substrate-binding domain-containing protein [Pelagibius sp. Alg239-R121]
MRFRSFDNLRLFDVVARHLSFTLAGVELNLTKGAVSYQIGRLEEELGFKVFDRLHRSIVLTEKGKRLWHVSQVAFHDLEREIAGLREDTPGRITIGLSSYFASRWLSPRLMTFMVDHPGIGLRLQPVIDLIDLRAENIDMAIRWGKGDWTDLEVELLFHCPAIPVAGAKIADRIKETGIASALPELTLLQDRESSVAWQDWHYAAGLAYHTAGDGLVVPDPNVRVQAVIDGQGVALNDSLVAPELSAGRLFPISDIALDNYGYYLAYPKGALGNPDLRDFRDWILSEAESERVIKP